MQLQVRLVHAEPGARVVAVTALLEGRPQATALGEGRTAEEAEDRARQRLQSRLGTPAADRPDPVPQRPDPLPARPDAAPIEPRQEIAPAAEAPPQPEEPAADPEDWSAELTRIDLQLQRLGWQRAEEGVYLERAFGHPSRGRITTYTDLLAYLQSLENFEAGSTPAGVPVPLRRRDLLEQSDGLLRQLGWDAMRGRERLEQEFGRSSRQQLSDAQLLHFNMLLEEEMLAAGPSVPGPGVG
jgi:hypothetical protein